MVDVAGFWNLVYEVTKLKNGHGDRTGVVMGYSGKGVPTGVPLPGACRSALGPLSGSSILVAGIPSLLQLTVSRKWGEEGRFACLVAGHCVLVLVPCKMWGVQQGQHLSVYPPTLLSPASRSCCVGLQVGLLVGTCASRPGQGKQSTKCLGWCLPWAGHCFTTDGSVPG